MKFTAVKTAPKDPVAGYRPLEEGGGPWILGYHEAAGRSIPRVSTRLLAADRLGALRVRLGIGRGRYRVLPGLYALGSPGPESPVLVGANYKLSFDALRRELADLETAGGAWILVLDTKGVNVWCAAGKGTFGTSELVGKLRRLRLGELVDHRELVLPQLGAPGISAPEVRRLSGFRVAWGPVRAADIPAYLASGKKKSPGMGRVRFGFRDRLVLAPVELGQSWPLLAAALLLALLAAPPLDGAWPARSLAVAAILVGAVLSGALLFPLLLFVLPSKAFAVKGAVLGLAWGLVGALIARSLGADLSLGLSAGLGLLSTAVVSYLGMNFTGSTTFTSPTGALAEVERSIIPQVATLGIGLLLSVAARIFGF